MAQLNKIKDGQKVWLLPTGRNVRRRCSSTIRTLGTYRSAVVRRPSSTGGLIDFGSSSVFYEIDPARDGHALTAHDCGYQVYLTRQAADNADRAWSLRSKIIAVLTDTTSTPGDLQIIDAAAALGITL